MKICHFIHTPRLSGAEILVYHLAGIQSESGHLVSVVSFAPMQNDYASYAEEMAAKGVTLVFPKRILSRVGRIFFYATVLWRLKKTGVFMHSVLPSIYARLANSIVSGRCMMVSVLHSASQDDFEEPILNLAESVFLPSPDGIIGVSVNSVLNYKRRFGYSGYLASCIENCVCISSVEFSETERSKYRSLLGVGEDVTVFIQVGRIVRFKNQHISLDAVLMYAQRHSCKCVLLFAGLIEDVDYCDELKRMMTALESDLCDVRFLGSRSDVGALLSCADAYLMPSAYEGFSVAYLEALASGLPVFATNIGAFAFSRKMSGVFLANIDEYAEYLSKIDIRIGARYKRDLSLFSPELVAAKYVDFLRMAGVENIV